MSWLDTLKLAIINEECDTIAGLYDTMPLFDTIEKKREASALIEQALVLLEAEKKLTSVTLKRIETIKKYGQGVMGHSTINRQS